MPFMEGLWKCWREGKVRGEKENPAELIKLRNEMRKYCLTHQKTKKAKFLWDPLELSYTILHCRRSNLDKIKKIKYNKITYQVSYKRTKEEQYWIYYMRIKN